MLWHFSACIVSEGQDRDCLCSLFEPLGSSVRVTEAGHVCGWLQRLSLAKELVVGSQAPLSSLGAEYMI